MNITRNLLLRMAGSRWLATQAGRRGFTRRAVKRFMPGEDHEAALDASASLATRGLTTVLTQLGENITSEAEADAVLRHYEDVIGSIAARGLPSEVSVKLTQLGLDQSSERCLERVDRLAALAGARGQRMWIDMEDSSYTDATLDQYRILKDRHEDLGVALQAYLYRTPSDLESLLPHDPIVRLVKGAYAEPASVAYPRKRDVDRAYFELAATLLEREIRGAVFGTHDLSLIDRIARRAEAAGRTPRDYEIHMLYGIRSADQLRLAGEGCRVGVLVSYGEHWFPWYMRRLAERPANVWFVARSVFG